NIIKTIDLIQDEKRKWCLVMEYAEGGSLFPKICGGLLTDTDVINCFLKQLIRGVAYLHSMGVAHRDLKPENLLLDKSNRILKITDFGVSDVFRAPFQSLARKAAGECGSGPYIAPEIFLEKEYNAELVDVWSIGVIYYAMLYRSAPWKISKSSDSRFKTYQDNQEGFWNVYRMVPPPQNVRKLLYRILEIEPSKRITTSELVEDEWVTSIEACECGMPSEATAHSHASLTPA
ncbi:serine/threonine-protein kinase HAL4/sat4, partial [Chytriomyces hyalinus]